DHNPNGENFKFTNPLGGYAFDIEGLDPVSSRMPRFPAFGSNQTAAEMAELYWMALLRDKPFVDLDPERPSDDVKKAIDELNKFSWFSEAGGQGPVTAANFLRARLPNK